MDRLIVVQHCQSRHHVDRSLRLPDRTNGLTDLGKAQAKAVARRLHAWLGGCSVHLLSSDMLRARETAEIVAEELGTELVLAAALREWSDAQALERDTDEEWTKPDPSESLFDWRPFPGHETWREFHSRLSSFMLELRETAPPDTQPVIVTHGGTSSNIVVWWLGLPIDALPERTCFSGSPGSISVLGHSMYGNPVVERLNDRAHLEDLVL